MCTSSTNNIPTAKSPLLTFRESFNYLLFIYHFMCHEEASKFVGLIFLYELHARQEQGNALSCLGGADWNRKLWWTRSSCYLQDKSPGVYHHWHPQRKEKPPIIQNDEQACMQVHHGFTQCLWDMHAGILVVEEKEDWKINGRMIGSYVS